MRVLITSPGQDTGGMGIRIKRAFDRHGGPEWQARAVRASENFIAYPADVETYRVPRSEVRKLYEQADVIHHSNSLEALARYGRGVAKPSVVTYQGTAFRTVPQNFLREAARHAAVQTVSTIDLLTLAPDVLRWSPHPIDITAMQALRADALERPELIVVHHSPTNRRVKSTQAFMEAMDRLESQDKRVRRQLVEGVRWDENLRLKARCDIMYDQLILGWGTNALEAWAMGIPVIAATEFSRVRSKMVDIIGPDLPCYEATGDTLYDALRTLINEPELRAAYGQRGLDYVARFHAEPVAVERLKGFYMDALEMHEAAA